MAKAQDKTLAKEAGGKLYSIPIRRINSNTNPRSPLSSSLQSQGWDCMAGDKQIWQLAVSDDAEKRAEFVKLIQDFDAEIVSLAATILSQGLLEPIEAREGGTGTFTLVFGARRCLAVLFNWCLLGKPKEPMIEAKLVKGNATTLLHRAVVENIRKPQSVIEEARAIQTALNAGETKDEVGRQLGMSLSTIDGRLKLLHLDPKVQTKLHLGKTTVKEVKAEQAERNGKPREDAKPPLRKRKEVEAAMDEFADGTPQRACLEWILGLREKIK